MIIYNNSHTYLHTINSGISHVSLLVLLNSSDRLPLRHRMTFFSVIAIFHGPALFSLRINLLYHPTQRPDLLRGYKVRGDSHYRRSSKTGRGMIHPRTARRVLERGIVEATLSEMQNSYMKLLQLEISADSSIASYHFNINCYDIINILLKYNGIKNKKR